MIVFYGIDNENLNYSVLKKINLLNIKKIEHIFFDENCNEIINSLQQMNIFNEKKIFVIHNASFLLKDNDGEMKEKIIDLLENNDNGDEFILIINAKSKTDFDSKIIKSKKIELNKVEKFDELKKNNLIVELLKKNEIFLNEDALSNLVEITANNPFIVENELNKIILLNKKNIDASDIGNFIIPSNDNNIFELINFILNNKKSEAIRLYDKLIENKYQPIELLQIISNQLFNLKLLKIAFETNMSSNEIFLATNMSLFQQRINKKNIENVEINKMNKLLDNLYTLDYNIKNGNINPYVSIKIFLIK
ncbi:MAG: DNA polymerase III subunit delta [Mycoplasmataceae bacterium]|jgi:DNA polymerase-3 subunit delta|nr:DNA polymerase III subunit delta [Mycoplasmataceae bacterium]